MTQQVSYNCIVCAKEFDNSDELHSIALSKINITKFKICQSCLNISDPTDDYLQARKIINSYAGATEVKHYFEAVKEIIESINK